MSQNFGAMTARLARDVPAAEGSIDDALIAVAALTTSAAMARRVTGLAAAKGQRTLVRLVKAQMSLLEVSGNILRAHGEIVELGKEFAGYDLRECPASAGADVMPMSSAA